MGPAPLPTHALHPIGAYVQKHYARPRWPVWMGQVPAAFEDFKVAGVDIGKIAKIVHRLGEGRRYALATWEWLRPTSPPSLKDLPSVQRMSGLEREHLNVFAERVSELARAVGREHPALELWVARRVALLEFVTHPVNVVPEDLKVAAMFLRNATLQAHISFPEDAVEAAKAILRTAMRGAADAAVAAFGAEETRVSANLMVPMPQGHPPYEPTEVARENSSRAAALWGARAAKAKRLVIVAEAPGAEHLGFWIPLDHGAGGATLPGAASAFAHRDGAVVFKDDLPALVGFPPELEREWRGYMERDFKEKLFFSLPYRVPKPTGGREAAAVLNVNVDADDLRVWRRAYHREWLCVARDRAEPFMEVAHAALRLIVTHESALLLDSGSDEFDRLIPVVPHKLLGGAS
jgi:hypothetical protein